MLRGRQSKLDEKKKILITRLQRVCRGFIVRRDLVHRKMPMLRMQKNLRLRMNAAAVVLTRVSRGMLARALCQRGRLYSSATSIEKVCRGFVVRAAVVRARDRQIAVLWRRQTLIERQPAVKPTYIPPYLIE